MQIMDEGALTSLGKLKGDPNKRSKDKYCCFHRDHGHDTTDCYDLKQQIEALIRQEKLQKFVSRERERIHLKSSLPDETMSVHNSLWDGPQRPVNRFYAEDATYQ